MSSVEILIACLERSLPFVAYRLPHQREIRLFVPEKIQKFFFGADSNLLSNEAFCIVPFDNERESAYLLHPRFDEELEKLSTSSLEWILNQELKENQLSFCEQEKENSYQEAFIKAKEKLTERAAKIVLSRRKLISTISLKEAPTIFLRLCERQKNTFNYFVSLPETGVWLGGSPELFLKNDGEKLHTVSLAGTLSAEKAGNWTAKEKEEQGMVSDFIAAILHEFGVKNYCQEKTVTTNTSNVQHLKTNFSFAHKDLKQAVEQFMFALFPTPAVNGLPKREAKDFILKNEIHKRQLYGGFMGKVEQNGQFNFFVSIRCMQFFSNGAALYVGGGLTADSDLSSEYAETELKAQGLIHLF